ncbi:trichodiene oxygenase [Pseudovirgaria hyperparasitica]|uniref:Trichodiene oxygenase n=1 Tax=Pseudovirgaria hyperparasitica TaxID=470096 RepID=A0A6A6W3G6_9PEZI|nr:trichodiene oxygenase [Pseudovirgaria hyperparasitica]KAF2757488.1 trichodiene oxygenase [Pseudovirgaria hyperparasitica]
MIVTVIQILLLSFPFYFIALAFYRLFLDPLSRIPGPKIAAITRYYEAYYDVVKKGQYTFKLRELHAKYGPIVRISPYEIHIHDPAFYEKLYRQDGRWNKYGWAWDALNGPGATIHTVDHDLHRRRRVPVNPYFSKASVARKHGMIQGHVKELLDRLDESAAAGSTVNIGGALTALAYDVATDFVLGKSYGLLQHPTFNVTMTKVGQSGGAIWRVSKHIRGYMKLMKKIPSRFMQKTDPAFVEWFKFASEIRSIVSNTITTHGTAAQSDNKAARNAIDVILDSDLPPEEKLPMRIQQDISVFVGAGTETSSSVLRMMLYHVYTTPSILHTLRAELLDSAVDPLSDPVSKLEQLPYLTAVLTEGMRLSPGLVTRAARIAPDRDIVYADSFKIPAGTPVSMTIYNMHMDPSIHADPKRFDPERWLVKPGEKKPFWAGFGRGTRICIGMHVAWAEIYTAFAALVLRYDVKFKDDVGAQDVDCIADAMVPATARVNGIIGWVSRRES